MGEYITEEIIIQEYLNNWFTYEELAEYLCTDINKIKYTLDSYCAMTKELNAKVKQHKQHIESYYRVKENNEEIYIYQASKYYAEIAKYIIENHASLRQTAKKFELGKTTVFDYVHEKLPSISIVLYKEVFNVLMENKSFSTKNKRVVEQVLTSYDYLKEGHIIEEIAQLQNIGRNVVQRNLTTRLQKIDKKKYEDAKEILRGNQFSGISEHKFTKHN